MYTGRLSWSVCTFSVLVALLFVNEVSSFVPTHVRSAPRHRLTSLSRREGRTNQPVSWRQLSTLAHGSRSPLFMVSDAPPKYIIVGGGTAGCVLANRLTENKDNSVLVLEAGSSKFGARDITMPIGILSEKGTVTILSPNPCPKVLGGSSCTNVMLYHRGVEADYDGWGVEGWGAKDVLPYFTKAENNRSKGKGEYHGKGGLMEVENVRYMNPLTKMFFKACEQAGLPKNDDFNDWGHSQEGFGRFQVAQKKGKRCSAASSYLKKAIKRENLSVETSAQLIKVLIEDGKAVGVEYVQEGEKRVAKVAPGGEVLLAGGAISSPQMLMLSGVGPAEHLESKVFSLHMCNAIQCPLNVLGNNYKNIEVKSDLPGVGKNLKDHPAVTVMADINKPLSITDRVLRPGSGKVNKLVVPSIVPAMMAGINTRFPLARVQLPNVQVGLQWMLTGTGPLTSPGCDNGAFHKTSPDKAKPDLQLRFVPGRSDTPDGVKAYNKIGAQGRPPSGVTLQVVGIRPESAGTVQLRSSDPFDKPQITTNYLESSADMSTLKEGITLARKLFSQSAFEEMVSKEVFPGKDNEQLEDYIKSTVHSANALVGTCKMGDPSDPMTVVDPALKVKGVSGLRVIDSSVMPNIPGGQTAAPTVMIAEKAADMLMTSA